MDPVALFIFYGIFGFATWVVMDMTGQMKHDHFAAAAAVFIFWPLFAVKYLAIGVSRVLQYGYLLLMEK